ncbi:MAG: hypothetical protein H5T97_02850, partial [Firmicutes bacterium]|nr:hypothetical protein [Bacillota bacterium]
MLVGYKQVEGDTFWHLKVGETIVKTLSVPKTDPFSWTAGGLPWHAHEWLWEALAWAGFSLAGKYGVWALTAAGALLFGGSLFALTRRAGAWGLFLAGFAVLAASPYWDARPHPLAQGLWARWVLLLAERAGGWGRRKAFLAALGLHAFWANAHASAPFGVATALAFALANRKETRYRWTLAGAAAGACLNPWGPEIFWYSFLVSRHRTIVDSVGEWLSPNFHEPDLLASFVLLAAACMWGCLRLAERGEKIPAAQGLLAVGTCLMALYSMRHLPYYFFSAAWLASACLERRPFEAAPGFVPRALAAAVAAVLFVGGVAVWPPNWTDLTREASDLPEGAVAFMKE